MIKRFISWCKHHVELYKERKQINLVKYAESSFNVEEYRGKIWFTFNSNLVCPISFLCEDETKIVATLAKLRKTYYADVIEK